MNRPIAAAAAAYAGLGLVGLIRPAFIPSVFGGTATTPDSRTELRAVYGALPLAFSGLLATSPAAAPAVAAATAAMAAGRAGGWLLEGRRANTANTLCLGAEVAVAAAITVGSRSGSTDPADT